MSVEMIAVFLFGMGAGAMVVSAYYAVTAGLHRWIYADAVLFVLCVVAFLVVAI